MTISSETEYTMKLIEKIKEKTGREPDLRKISQTVERWIARMRNPKKKEVKMIKVEGGEEEEDEDDDEEDAEEEEEISPIEYTVPTEEGESPLECVLWSVDELRRLKARRVPDKVMEPFEQINWLALDLKGSGKSPVDIRQKEVKKCLFRPVKYYSLFDNREVRMINDGRNLVIKLSWDAYMNEGPLFGTYKFDELRIYWSDDPHTGTAHALNGKRFAFEANFVFQAHCCKGYRGMVRKKQRPIAIVSILFREHKTAPFYQTFSYCSQVIAPEKNIWITENVLKDFKPALMSSDYYNYAGSVISSEKPEEVEWILLKKVMPIRKRQVDCLRKLSQKPIELYDNIIPELLPLDKRTVLATFENPAEIYCEPQNLVDCGCEY